ncbi:MAG: GAF domain-containing protein [Variovorax sp.]|nr:MAG: GAF domain-containing protein [Variovorax sp.]
MRTPPARQPATEADRLAELKRLAILDSSEEQAFDDITRMAASLCGTPIALITLLDDKRQWFKSRVGLQATETPREVSFCTHAIQTPDVPFVVRDALEDPRFVANPLVTGDPNIRFYAGAPLVTRSGNALGTICVIDRTPRDVTPEQLEQLQFMAQQVIALLESREVQSATAPAGPSS